MIISRENKIVIIDVYILIVDDTKDQAFNLSQIISSYVSILNGRMDVFGDKVKINYNTIINGDTELTRDNFDGIEAFNNSMKYIDNNIHILDVVLCDYHLFGKMNGDDLLKHTYKKEIRNGVRIFKILISISSKYQILQDQEYVDYIFNVKNSIAIKTVLLKYFEENILTVKLFGNPLFFNSFYNGDGVAKYLNEPVDLKNNFLGHEYIHIFYLHSCGGKRNYILYYLDKGYTLQKYTFEVPIYEVNIEKLFYVINKDLYVSKLWFADNDVVQNSLLFINPTNKIIALNIDDINVGKTHKLELFDIFIRKPKKFDYPQSNLNSYFKF